jgi:hypothetical protein
MNKKKIEKLFFVKTKDTKQQTNKLSKKCPSL